MCKFKFPKFNKEEIEQLNKYLSEWDKYRREEKVSRPDYTSDAIFLLPLTIALLKSEAKIEKLTRVLIWLTVILTFETAILICPVAIKILSYLVSYFTI